MIGATGPFHELIGARIDNDVRFAMLGGTIVGQNALLRFYVLHCMAIPLVFCVLLAVHFWRIRKDGGISRPESAEPGTESPHWGPRRSRSRAAPAEAIKPPEPPGGARYRLLAYVPGKTYSAKRDWPRTRWPPGRTWWSREFVAALTAIIVLWMLAILVNSPLEEKANPALTPNPAKAPVVFRGLAGIARLFRSLDRGRDDPDLRPAGPGGHPLSGRQPCRLGEYGFRKRKLAVSIFTFGFLLWFALIFIGLFMRGPSWAWYWPGEDWTVPKETALATRNLPCALGRPLAGRLLRAGPRRARIALPQVPQVAGPRALCRDHDVLLLLMIGVPAKIVLRLALNIKYVFTSVWFNI